MVYPLPQVRSLKASANAAADESANAKFRLQTARQAVSELREMIVEARTPHASLAFMAVAHSSHMQRPT